MKRNVFLWSGVVCILAALLSSCTKESGMLDKPLEADQSFFATVNVVGTDAMTRAEGDSDLKKPDFDKGTTDENKVNTIYLIFYDKSGNRVSTTQVRSERGNKEELTTDPAGSVNSIYKGVVQIDVKHGSLAPAYVMAFINPITSQNFEINPDFATLESLAKTTRPMIISQDDETFAMSKSVYYGTNRVTGKDHERIVATPLVAEGAGKQLFTSVEDAQKALDDYKNGNATAPIVDIYVERYAAKVSFSLSEAAEKAEFVIKEDDEVKATLKFVPEYWAVNAYESNTYIVKSFLNEEAVGQDDGFTDQSSVLTWQELNIALGSSDGNTMPWYWNSEEYHRCYWAQSPAYYAKQYPRVADDILDKQGNYAYHNYYALGYYSYNDMADNAQGNLYDKARKLSGTGDNGKPEEVAIYARENTVAGKALKAAASDPMESPKAAIPSVVMVGHYNLDGAPVPEDEFFYIMGNSTNGYTIFKNYEEAIAYLMKVTIKFEDGDTGQSLFNTTTDKFTNAWNTWKNYFIIKHPNMAARGEDGSGTGLVLDSRFVTVQLKSIQETDPKNYTSWGDGKGLYALVDGEYVEVTDDNVGRVNQQMLYAAGTLQGFQGGKAYFNIPIKHLGFHRSNNANEGLNANDKDFDWDAVQSGDFGLVRNHSYTIIVDQIKGLGNGIPDPNDPIVPPTDPEEYFIGARILVLNWAVVPDQHVIL